MEVSHKADHITHAIVGGMQAEELQISQTAEFFQILSSTLYSDKQLAVIREVLCNAWDAHIEAECTHLPVIVTLTEKKLTIKDSGKGISRSMIVPIYGTYGGSTKTQNKKVTGGFGLGCKAPFAYTEHFGVTSCHDGVKTIYRMALSAAQVNGRPSIMPIVEVPTTETGITVEIDVKSAADYARFLSLVRQIARFGEMKVLLNEREVPILPFSDAAYGFVLVPQNEMPNANQIHVRCGNVVYPLSRNDDYDDLWDAARDKLLAISGRQNYYSSSPGVNWSLVLLAEPDTVSFTPSRESLSLTERTIASVSKLLSEFIDFAGRGSEEEMLRLLKAEYKKFATITDPDPHVLISHNPYHPKAVFSNQIQKKQYLSNRTDVAMAQLSHRLPKTATFYQKELVMRIDTLLDMKVYDRGMLQSLRSFAIHKDGKTSTTWFQSKVAWPIVRELEAVGINRKYVHVYDGGSFSTRLSDVFLPISGYRPSSFASNFAFLDKTVVLGHSRQSVYNRFPTFKEWKNDISQRSMKEVISCILPRNQALVNEAITVFGRLGYKVIDLTKIHSWEAPAVHAKATRTYKPTPRKKGVPLLSAFKLNGGGIDFERLFSEIENSDRSEKPACYVKVSRRFTDLLHHHIPRSVTPIIHRYYGSKIGVVYSENGAQKCREQGIPELKDWFFGEIAKAFKGDPSVKAAYLTSDTYRTDLSYFQSERLKLIRQNEQLAKLFKLPVHDPKSKATDLLRVYMTISTYLRDTDKSLKPLKALIASWGKCPRVDAVLKELDNAKLMSILKVDNVLKILNAPETPKNVKDQLHDILVMIIRG